MDFLYVNVLYFMLIPSIILMILIITKGDSFSKYFSKKSLEKLSVSNKYFSNKARNITLFLALTCMIIALARPVTNEKTHKSKQELTSLIIAIDVSKSMLANDIYPNRLDFAKKKVLQIIKKNQDKAIGIILFAKSSFILSPLSQDHKSLEILVNNLDTGQNFDNGTNIYSSLELTNKLLRNYENKNLLILSDGADKEDFQDEIDYANKNNISVYIIATASKNGAAIKLKNGDYLTHEGKIINVKINENIKKLALSTNAGYINYSLNDNDINEIIKDIESKSKKEQFKSKRFKTYRELFYYPLAFGIFLLFIGFSSLPNIKRKKNLITMFLGSFILFYQNESQASIMDFKTIKEANEAYEKKDYKKAQKNYEKLENSNEQNYNLANSFYKQNNFKEAINKYKNIKDSNRNMDFKKYHNLGNAYAKNKQYQEAINAYEQALKIKDEKQTKENLHTVKKHLENKEKKQQQNEQNQNNKDKKSNKQKNKENKKEQNSNKKSQKNKEEKKDKKQNSKKNELNKNKENAKKVSQKEISDKEEKRWLKQLKEQKTNSLLKKFESSKQNQGDKPW